MPKKFVVGNWKLNNNLAESTSLIEEILAQTGSIPEDVHLGVSPSFLFLNKAIDLSGGDLRMSVVAQNVSHFEKGAYTGEVSADMLSSLRLEYCIVGHSERRQYFGESNADIKSKVDLLLQKGISPIVCIGENLAQRKEGSYLAVLIDQIDESLFHLEAHQISNVILAYEPIWAIGTGETATPAQAQEVHKSIRNHLIGKYGGKVAKEIPILYGGSCKPDNAKELFAQNDINGGLIGGASLNATEFLQIANSF